uniref:Uncharacterized protein n=1 Tax=Arundo donax TaxID=35708 RepID=A0A0A9H084_ARUDO
MDLAWMPNSSLLWDIEQEQFRFVFW